MIRDEQKAALQRELDDLLNRANDAGFVVTASTIPMRPLAMGHYLNVGEVYDWQTNPGRADKKIGVWL